VGYVSVFPNRAVFVHVVGQVIASLNGDSPTVMVVGQILAVVVATTQRAAQAGADAVQVRQRSTSLLFHQEIVGLDNCNISG